MKLHFCSQAASSFPSPNPSNFLLPVASCLIPALKRLRTGYCPNITLGFSFQKLCIPDTSMCNFPSAPCTKPSERRCLLEFKARKGYKIRNGPKAERDGLVNGTLRRITEPLNRRCANSPSELAPREGYEEQACLRSLTTAPKDPHDRNGAPLMTFVRCGPEQHSFASPFLFHYFVTRSRWLARSEASCTFIEHGEARAREKKAY
ncbi:CBM_collapsed_G0003370.mRNA.1.CDS.1 [Saccharomyces cerevisiae]|nr:CBM_collapsed_G0003370.mRNA.1.CDS.1 [Saccharomyces cerevisiae]